MRLTAELVLGLLAIGLLAALVSVLAREGQRRRWARAARSALWEDGHYSSAGLTHVVVHRVARLPSGAQRELESQTIDSIPDGAPDWRARFDAARLAAYDRAISLNQPTLH
ncbi:MAG: hypothetical protein ACJ73E_10670 [Mycobacteriales bacterium]